MLRPLFIVVLHLKLGIENDTIITEIDGDGRECYHRYV